MSEETKFFPECVADYLHCLEWIVKGSSSFRGSWSILAMGWIFFLMAFSAHAQTSEFRALWVDAWGPGFFTPAQTSQLIADCRTYNFNAVVVQMRRRGDAFYFPQAPNLEPRTTAVSSNYDALADLIAKAHSNSPRIEVHCWVVANLVWSSTTPPASPAHVVNAHPEYLMKNFAGQAYLGEGIYLDPGNPEAMAWNRRMALDITKRYDIDGFHWDYIRYPQADSGYNDVAIQRYNREFGTVGKPAISDPQFSSWRRRQATDFLRWVNADLLEIKPHLVISAAVFGSRTDAFNARFQDWAAWTREGIIDVAMPMNYSGDNSGVFNPRTDDAFLNLGIRSIYMGQGAYLNTPQNTVTQLKYARTKGLKGTILYSYRNPNSGAIEQAATLNYVKQNYQPTWVPTPVLPWKAFPTKGIVKGTVTLPDGTMVYNATIRLNANPILNQRSEAHGAFAFFEVPSGTYAITASASGLGVATNTIIMEAGRVKTVNLVLTGSDSVPPAISEVEVSAISDTTALISWITDEDSDGVVQYGTEATDLSQTANLTEFARERSVTLDRLFPDTIYYYRVLSTDQWGNKAQSKILSFRTNPEGVIAPIVIDNTQAQFVGSWVTASSAPDKFGADYRYKGQGTGAAFVQYTPTIFKKGLYEVYVWYPQGANRTTTAGYTVTYGDGTTQRFYINQQINGGAWRLLGRFNFNEGTNGNVRLNDVFIGTASVVMADAVRFAYVPPIPAPLITKHPESQTVIHQHSITFRVEASGQELSYQWKHNGKAIVGARGTFLTVEANSPDQEGEYIVEVSNSSGTSVSRPATLVIAYPPQILNQPVSLTVEEGSPFYLSVIVSGAEPLVYQWMQNGVMLENKTGSSLEISKAQPGHAGEYRVSIENGIGTAFSDPAIVTVLRAKAEPQFSSIFVEGNSVQLNLSTIAGRTYILEASKDLKQWTRLSEFTATSEGYQLNLPLESEWQFFRALLNEPLSN